MIHFLNFHCNYSLRKDDTILFFFITACSFNSIDKLYYNSFCSNRNLFIKTLFKIIKHGRVVFPSIKLVPDEIRGECWNGTLEANPLGEEVEINRDSEVTQTTFTVKVHNLFLHSCLFNRFLYSFLNMFKILYNTSDEFLWF